MSDSQVAPVAGTPAPVAPAAPKSAIEIIEQEIQGFLKQREQAIANMHAVEGAIQAANFLLSKLRAEAAKAEAEAKKLVGEVETEVSKAVTAVEAEAKKL